MDFGEKQIYIKSKNSSTFFVGNYLPFVQLETTGGRY